MAVYLGFSAHIRGIDHPAVAIFKLDRGETYCWPGDHPTEGYLAVFDLVSAKKHFFLGWWEGHGSRHKSGERHQTLVSAGRKVHIATRKDEASEDMVSWSSIRSVTVPLTEPFDFWPINSPTWAAVKSPHILRREDFGEDIDGVFLHGYICRHDRVDDLVSTWRATTARSWTTREQDFALVVLAEVVKIPKPTSR
jgi:hypothetical protein